jgi:hypothetical protein
MKVPNFLIIIIFAVVVIPVQGCTFPKPAESLTPDSIIIHENRLPSSVVEKFFSPARQVFFAGSQEFYAEEE